MNPATWSEAGQWLLLLAYVASATAIIGLALRNATRRRNERWTSRLQDVKRNFKVERCNGRWHKRTNNILGR